MIFQYISDSSDAIITKVYIHKEVRNPTISVMVESQDYHRYLALKKHLGEKRYYHDYEKLSILCDDYTISLTSTDYKLIKYFLKRISEISPEFCAKFPECESISIGYAQSIPYHSESELPKWHMAVDFFGDLGMSKNFVIFKACDSSARIKEIRFIFEIGEEDPILACIVFENSDDANNALTKLRTANNLELNDLQHDASLYFKTSCEHIQRFKLAINALKQIDESINNDLIRHINKYMPENAQLDQLATSQPCRFQSTEPLTLIQKITAVKHKPKELKEVLDSLGDTLLFQDDDPKFMREESESALDQLVHLNKTDQIYRGIFREIYEAKYLNKDDLKYILKKRLFHFHFLFSNNDERWKKKHLGVLQHLVRGLLNPNIPLDRELNQREVEDLRKLLLKVKSRQDVPSGHIKRVSIALMILSKYYPVNQECYITLDVPEPHDRVFTTTGFQFSLKALNEYNKTRSIRNDLGENELGQFFVLPNNRCAVDEIDKAHITSLTLGAIYSNNYSNVLEGIYDVQFYKRALQLGSWVRDDWGSDLYRLAAMANEHSDRFFENVRTNDVILLSIDLLITSGLSIEQFAQLETDKQIALCSIRNNVYSSSPMVGLDFDNLIQLSAVQIMKLFEGETEHVKNHASLAELNSQIQKLLNEPGSPQLSSVRNVN